MSTANDAIVYARTLVHDDTNGLTDTIGLQFANDALQDFIRDLIDHDIDAAQTLESYTSMAAGQGGYSWPSNMYALKTIEIDYTGAGGNNYIQAEIVDIANLQGSTSFDFLRKNQSTSDPLIDNHGDTFEVFPTPLTNVANAIKIVRFVMPTEYTTTSSVIAYPLSLDYRALGAKIASLYSLRLEKPDISQIWDVNYQNRLKKIVSNLAPESKQPIQPEPLHITGWNF